MFPISRVLVVSVAGDLVGNLPKSLASDGVPACHAALHTLFELLLCSTTSSALVDCAFLQGVLLIHRTKMSDALLDVLVFLKYNS